MITHVEEEEQYHLTFPPKIDVSKKIKNSRDDLN